MIEIGIIGAGAMGSGIAQVVAQAGHEVTIIDTNDAALQKAMVTLAATMDKLVAKGKLSAAEADAIQKRTHYRNSYSDFAKCELIIEAIVENLDIKKKVFAEVETYVSDTCILASNTSSLSLTAIASACTRPDRVIGIHFFNPAPLMALVEIIPALQTHLIHVAEIKKLVESWKKVPVLCKDTPGFIVNRVARPFYGEAIRIYEEGIADFATIDQAMREKGFKMGPFELMDMIGNDVNYAVTESVFTAFYYDPRYKPSFTQKKLNEAGWLGRKTGKGYYDYSEGVEKPVPSDNAELKERISSRILAMLINEAFDAAYLNVATEEDIDLAMTKGVNYPKGLITWAKEIGLKECVKCLDDLYESYHEDRYRCSVGLRKAAANH